MCSNDALYNRIYDVFCSFAILGHPLSFLRPRTHSPFVIPVNRKVFEYKLQMDTKICILIHILIHTSITHNMWILWFWLRLRFASIFIFDTLQMKWHRPFTIVAHTHTFFFLYSETALAKVAILHIKILIYVHSCRKYELIVVKKKLEGQTNYIYYRSSFQNPNNFPGVFRWPNENSENCAHKILRCQTNIYNKFWMVTIFFSAVAFFISSLLMLFIHLCLYFDDAAWNTHSHLVYSFIHSSIWYTQFTHTHTHEFSIEI